MTTPRSAFAQRLASAIEAVRHGQHPNGEMLSFRRDPSGGYAYVRSPFLSTFVHDALGCLDPTSSTWLEHGDDLLPTALQAQLVRSVVELRRRIRSYLIWQQEAAGYWRFFGRGSGLDPDVNSTACASVALLDGYGVVSVARWELQQDVLLSFRSPTGPFFTFIKPRCGGYGWLSETGVPVVGFDRVVNAEVLRCLSRIGRGATVEATTLADWLYGEVIGTDAAAGSPLYPNPVSFAYVASRALEGSNVDRHEELTAALRDLTRRLQRPDGGFGGPLSTAMGAMTLLTLRELGPELAAARLAVLRAADGASVWPYEDFVVHGFGAPAWTTALSASFLVHHYCATGEAPV